MTHGIHIDGDATINGVNSARVGKLIAGMDEPEATEIEKKIAAQVAKRVAKMEARGYLPAQIAAFARKMVHQAALGLG